MLHSNRILLDLGMPELDDRAFIREGRNIKPMIGGGGQSSAPTSQTITQTNIPDYARPYAEAQLGEVQALTDINQNPYTPYEGQRFAGFSPMQAQAFQNIAGQQVAPQLADASNLAYTGAQQGLGAQQNAMGLQQTALGYGQAGSGFGIAGAQQAQRASQLAQAQALGYGAQGAQFGASGADMAAQSQRMAEGQADLYGQMGAGFGTSAAELAPQAQAYGAQGSQFGQAGAGYGAQGAGIGGIGVQQAQQGFDAGARYAQQATSPEAMQAYMSPYMQNAVDRQTREARRQSEIDQQQIQSQATQQGAFGGTRSTLLEAERQRNLGTQLGDIQARGTQQAYEDAQQAQQFGAGLGIQGLQAGYQGLQAGMAGTAQGMQGAETGIRGAQSGLAGLGQAGDLYGKGMQGAGLGLQGTGQRLDAGRLGLAGTAQGMQGSEVGLRGVGQQISSGQLGLEGARTGIAGTQAGLQGVGQSTDAGRYGLSGAEVGIRGAGQLGQLGGQQFDQQMNVTDAMQKYGALQQQQEQQMRDFQYQQFLAQQQYPYQQQSYRSDIMSRVPSAQSAQFQYDQQPNQTAQLAGAGLAAYGAYNRKEGGQIKKYQEGGQVSADAMSTMAVQEMPSRLRRLSDSQLAAYARNVKDAVTLSAIQSEMTRRARTRMPQGEVPEITTAEGIAKQAEAASLPQGAVGMYGGGIVALQGGGVPVVSGMEEYGVSLDTMTQRERTPRIEEPVERLIDALKSGISTGPYAGGSTSGSGGEKPIPTDLEGGVAQGIRTDPVMTPERWAQQYKPTPTDLEGGVAQGVGIPGVGEQRRQENEQQTPPAPSTGQGPAASPSTMTFDQWRKVGAQVTENPEDQAVLDDMKARVDSRMARAKDQDNVAKYDAIMMAGLAMMSGTSLADGIARAAETGGAQFMESKDKAAEAINAAEDTELAFRKYQMELRKGDEAAAQSEFESYMDYSVKMQQIGATREVGLARAARSGATGLDANTISLIRGRVENTVNERFKDLSPPADKNKAAQRESDKRDLRNEMLRSYGIAPLKVQPGGGSGGADLSGLASTIKPK